MRANMIKITVAGTQGAGKSYFCKELYDILQSQNKEVCLITEVTKHCPYHLNETTTAAAQGWIWHEQLRQEITAQNVEPDVILCDRSLMDHIVYFKKIVDKKHNLCQKHLEDNYTMLYSITKEWMHSYDYVVRLPLNLDRLKSGNNPLRSRDVTFAKEIDRLFDEVVSPFVNINKDDLLAMVKNEL